MFWQSQREAVLKKELDKLKADNGRLKEKSESEAVKKASKITNLNERVETLESVEKRLKESIADLNLKKKREEELIKHNTKIIIEKHEIEQEKVIGKLKGEKAEEIAKIKDEYRDKTEKQLEKQATVMKELYTDVLEKLTGVTGTLGKPAGVSIAGKAAE